MDSAYALVGAVSIAATTIQMLLQLNSVYRGVSSSTYNPPKKILSELPVLISLLQEIQQNASNSYTEPPRTVSVALEISVERFQDLILCLESMGLDPQTGDNLPGKRHKMQRLVQIIHLANTERLQDATKRFRSVLTLLRDIAMDHRTQDLITQQREFLRYEFQYLRKALQNSSLGDMRGNLSPEDDGDPKFDGAGDTEHVPSFQFSPGLGFSIFSVTFSLDVAEGEKPIFYPAKAKFDTGCADCLISEAVIRKYDLHEWLEKCEERTYVALGNSEVTCSSLLHINWSANNETTLRRNLFYVVADSPFELLLGETFMNANSRFHPALPIRLRFGKSKEDKVVEAEREVKDDLEGRRLAAERIKGKAVVKPTPQETQTTAGPSAATTNRQPPIQPSQTSQVQHGEMSQAARIADTQLPRTQNHGPPNPPVPIPQDPQRNEGPPNVIMRQKSEQEALQQSHPVNENAHEGKAIEQVTSHDSGYGTDPTNNSHVLENRVPTIGKELEQLANKKNGWNGIVKGESSRVEILAA